MRALYKEQSCRRVTRLAVSGAGKNAYSSSRRTFVHVSDGDSMGFPPDEGFNSEGSVGYLLSSSEGEESDGEIMLNPITEVDLPTARERFRQSDDAFTVTAHEIFGRIRKRSRVKYGFFINVVLMTFLMVLLILVDWCAWRIVRLPLPPFHLIRPFLMSAFFVACAGYICVPFLRRLKKRSAINKGPSSHSNEKGPLALGGLFLVLIGIVVAEVLVSFSSIEVSGAVIATLFFAVIGLLDDLLRLTAGRKASMPSWTRILLEAAVVAWFSFWLCTADMSSPYSMYTFL